MPIGASDGARELTSPFGVTRCSSQIESVLGYVEREHVVEAITATRQLKDTLLEPV